MHNQHEFLQFAFESIEFRLEIFSPGDFRYPPFIFNIRKGASGITGYRSLHLLNIANPALLDNFKTLKVAAHLPADKIILELALSQRTNQEDWSLGQEQPISTYLIGEAETVELRELAQVGLAPMTAKAVRVTSEDVPLNQIPLENYTTGLQVVNIRKKANLHLVTLENVSNKSIRAYSITHAGGSATRQLVLPPRTKEAHIFSFFPHLILAPQRASQELIEPAPLVIRSLEYDDGTYEGMPITYPPMPTI